MKRTITTILFSSFFLASCGKSSPVDSGGEGNPGAAPEIPTTPVVLELSRSQSIGLGLDPDIEDTDGDGVSDADEVGTDPSNPVDSDGDGIIDALEAGSTATDNAQSVLTLNVSEATANTLALPDLSGQALKITVNSGEIDPAGLLISESSLAGDESDPRDADYDFPHGLFDFKLSLGVNTSSSSVTLEYPDSLTITEDAVLRVRKVNGSWVSLTSASQTNGRVQIPFFNTDGVSERNANLQIADGGDYDLDPAPNKIRYLTGLGEQLLRPSVVSIESISPEITEGDNVTTIASFKLTLDAVALEALTVAYETSDGTAQSPSDYTSVTGGTITIEKGQLTTQINIPIISDTTPESNEIFSLKLLSVTPNTHGVISTTNQMAQVTLIDDDPDADSDTVEDSRDNCPSSANTNQANADTDGKGNACDTDDDNDGLTDAEEATRGTDPLKSDTDGDSVDDLKDELPLDPNKVLTLKSAHRLLLQTTFGPLSDDMDKVQQIGAEKWIDRQLNMTAAHDSATDDHRTHLERLVEIAKHAKPNQNWDEAGEDGLSIFNRETADFATDDYQMAAWWENVIGLHPTNTHHGSDQLRQRVAFALSQLLVVSSFEGSLMRRGEGLANYYDMLVRYSFGNYRDLLGEMARNPVMGVYLSHQGNQKTNLATGTIPDENFARELMQLFTIGLYELNMDGSPDRDNNQYSFPDTGEALTPTYTEEDVQELAKVMTGWDLASNTRYGRTSAMQGNYIVPMEFTASEHEDETAIDGDGMVTVFGESLALNSGDDGSGLDEALDLLFNHPNVAPYVSKHLIMRLVTSNPSSEYVARVANVFVNNGQGVRGDLKAVVRAILLDDDVRDTSKIGDDDGKVKEPLIAFAQLLRTLGTLPLDGWASNDEAKTPVSGVYWFKYPERTFGQGALRSPSVFNFYAPDYVPSSSYFSKRGLVSPEMKILTDQNVLSYANKVYWAVWTFVENKMIHKNNTTAEEFAKTRKFNHDINILSNFDEPLALMRAAAGGDFANFESLSASERPNMTAAVNTLIDHYNRLLLGGEMPDTFRNALFTYLMGSTSSNWSDKEEVAMIMVKDTLHMIATSNVYMVQK